MLVKVADTRLWVYGDTATKRREMGGDCSGEGRFALPVPTVSLSQTGQMQTLSGALLPAQKFRVVFAL